MDNEDYGISDAGHVETMFTAMTDTMDGVAGAEGFGLTSAQQYAFGALDASGDLSRQQRVDGNESFFGAISDGVKKIYDYIVKMFKSVWGFFFNKDAPKAVEEAKKEVKEEKQKIEAFERASGPEAAGHAKKALGVIKTHASKTGVDKDEGTIDLDNDTMEDIKRKLETGSASDRQAATTQLMDLMPKANKGGQKKFKKAAEEVVTVNKKFVAMIQEISVRKPGEAKVGRDSKAGALASKLAEQCRAYEPIVTKNIATLVKREEIKDKADAKRALDEITADIVTGDKIAQFLKSLTSEINSEITAVEKLMSAGPLTAEGKSDLDALHSVLSRGTTVAQYLKSILTAQTTLAKSIAGVFGI